MFGVIATFSAEVSKGQGDQRLLRSGDCGYWVLDTESSVEAATTPYMHKLTNDSLVAASYARACYGGNPAILQCGTMPVGALQWTANQNASCPFEEGMCIYGDTAAYQMSTGLLDSHTHLGINAPSKHRIKYRKVTTCAPINQRGHTVVVNGSTEDGIGVDGDLLYEFYYGPIAQSSNHTYRYNTHAYIDGFGWTLQPVASTAPHDRNSGWLVDSTMNRTDADVSLLFIAPNGVLFAGMSNDPIFGAHTLFAEVSDEISYYDADLWVSTLACAEQHQICNPRRDEGCTPLVGANQLLLYATSIGLNDVQLAAATRIAMNTAFTSVQHAVWTRGANALRAQEHVTLQLSAQLPDNQWHIEVGSWFDTGLARLQQTVQEYATGPRNIISGSHLWQPGDEDHLSMCTNQIVKDTEGTVSFSVAGLVIIFVIGCVVIFTSFVLDAVVGWVQRKTGIGAHKDIAWFNDDKLQMQRTILEGQGFGRWENKMGFPVVMRSGAAEEERFVAWNGASGHVPGSSSSVAATSAAAASEAMYQEKLVTSNAVELRR